MKAEGKDTLFAVEFAVNRGVVRICLVFYREFAQPRRSS